MVWRGLHGQVLPYLHSAARMVILEHELGQAVSRPQRWEECVAMVQHM